LLPLLPRHPRTLLSLFRLLILLAFTLPAFATDTPSTVTVGDQPVFTVRTSIGSFTAAERAAAVSARLNQLVKDSSRDPHDIHPVTHPYSTDIVLGDLVISTITEADATASGQPRDALVVSDINLMRDAVLKVRSEYTSKSILLGAVYALITTIALIAILILFSHIFPTLYRAIESARGNTIRTIRIQSLELLSELRLTELLLYLARLIRFVVTLLLLYFYIPFVFSFFPWTRSYGATLFGYIATPVRSGWIAFIHYLPSLLVLLVISFFTYLALRLVGFIFREVERGTISWPGFYPEWATPTLKIVQLLILAFALIVGFPYLPGSESPAFKGVSIFLGVIFSLGSSSSIANVISGILLTYTRAFRVGDRVQIGDTIGDVMEKGLLATHVRTIKNVLITIPNSLVLNAHIINFSRSTESEPLILHVTVSIGYDAPWRTVHELLKSAALATNSILPNPAPFVLQTSLDDFYVSYQINAYTREPQRMAVIYSLLNQNIQDKFNEAGVEIMSPHYGSLRDGNATTIPANYLPSNYEAPPFVTTNKPPTP
jgi:small-conductance mechanosensitive channel